jgi:hypothetical protein
MYLQKKNSKLKYKIVLQELKIKNIKNHVFILKYKFVLTELKKRISDKCIYKSIYNLVISQIKTRKDDMLGKLYCEFVKKL